MKEGRGKQEGTLAHHVHHELNEPEMVRKLNDIGRDVGAQLPEGYGFALFIFTYGKHGSLFYLSSAEREDIDKLLEEYLRRRGKR